MAKSHNQPFQIPDFDGDIVILEMENDDIILDDQEEPAAETEQPAAETEQPAAETEQPAAETEQPQTTEAVYTPTPGETLIAQNQVAGFSLISVVLFVICGILAGFEVFKIWTHQ